MLDSGEGNRTTTILGVVLMSALVGLGTAIVLPRGPITAAGVLLAATTGAGLGFLSGFLLRSRWAMLLAPAVSLAAYELGRLDTVGPSVDLPRLDLAVGVIVFVLGRGFHGVVWLLPMVVGAAFGAGLARHRAGPHVPLRGWSGVTVRLRRGVAVAVAIGLATLSILMVRPGRTEPIVAADGRPVTVSVAELATVRLGGHDQKVLIRGRSVDKPVLLYLAGGPGQSDLGYTRAYMDGLEDDFVFAVWDQRGSGTSYSALDPTSTWTLDQAVADTVELSRYLIDRFGESKIYLFGNSWGSTLGVLAVQRNPELFHAYIGSGQMVSQRESDQIIYRQAVELGRRTGDTALIDRLEDWGPPPYRDLYAYAFMLGYYDKIGPYPKTEYFETRGPTGLDGNGASEYGLLDKVNKLKALFDMGWVMYPQLQDLDFRRDVPTLQVPVYLIQGRHELAARTEPAREWFGRLHAPAKLWITFEASGHIPQFEEFGRFRQTLTDVVVAQTYPHD